MKLQIVLTFVALIVGVTCQTTKPTTKPATTKPAITTKPTTTKPKVTSSEVPEFTTPPPTPVYTCNNITGVANFNFAKYATGKWYLWRELSAWPFSYCVGQCVVSTFTPDPKNAKAASVSFNALIEGNFTKSPVSVLTANTPNGVNKWDFTAVGINSDTLNATSDINYVVIDTDYVNWAAVYACGNLCVYVNTTKPLVTSSSCSPGPVNQYMILLRSRAYTSDLENAYVKNATDALNAKWPYMPFLPVDQSAKMCTN